MSIKLAVKVDVGVSSTTTGNEKTISIRLVDPNSGIHFAEVDCAAEDFMDALIFRKSEVPGIAEIQDQWFDKLGMKRERANFKVEFTRKDAEPWLSLRYGKDKSAYYDAITTACQARVDEVLPGWFVSGYFGSQGDVMEKSGTVLVSCKLFRFTGERNVIN